MQIDELILKLKSDFNKVVSDANSLISKFTKLDNSTSKVSNDFENISKSASSMGNGFKASERNIESLERQLSRMKSTFTEHVSLYRQWGDLATTKTPDSIKGLSGEELSKSFGDPITKDSLLQEKQDIDALQSEISELKAQVSSVPKLKVVPNTKEGEQNIKNVGDEANKTGRKFDNLSNKTRKVGSSFSSASGSFKDLKKGFSGLGNKISSSMDRGLKSVKKLALGLVGVRTVMSVLTRSVNAYLSFDGELQNSLSNSWNMLGSLLAPAIELVANLFATATNYIYRFVQALTGIDLVARANAKALQTQAKATKKTADAQRGLLGMDEITNLPTEPGGGSDVPQISAPEIDSSANKFIKDLVAKIKAGDWYGAGVYIAERINAALEKLDIKALTDKLKQGILNITDMLNGFVETLDWALLGQKTSDFIVGVTGAIRAGIENIHWDSIGNAISDFLNNIDWVGLVDNIVMSIMGIIKGLITIFNKIDFVTLMKNLSDAFRKGLQDITQVLSEIDWKKVGNQIVDILVNIDWLGIATDIVGLLAQGLLSIGDLLIGALDSIIDIVNDPKALSKMLEAGANLMFGLFKGMVSVVAKIGEVIDKIIELVLSLFGIHSPSTVFAEMGTNLILGLINGINSVIQGVINIFSNLWNTIVDGGKKAWDGIKSAFNSIKDFFGGIINTIMGMFRQIGTAVGNVVAGAFKGVINAVLRTVENVLNAPIRAINSLIKVINKVPGINIGRLETFNLPRLETGTNNIESEGIYHLHEGEAVVPKKYNPATGGYNDGNDNREIINLLVALNSTMLEYAERPIRLDINGRKVAEGIYDDMQSVSRNKNTSTAITRS